MGGFWTLPCIIGWSLVILNAAYNALTDAQPHLATTLILGALRGFGSQVLELLYLALVADSWDTMCSRCTRPETHL